MNTLIIIRSVLAVKVKKERFGIDSPQKFILRIIREFIGLLNFGFSQKIYSSFFIDNSFHITRLKCNYVVIEI